MTNAAYSVRLWWTFGLAFSTTGRPKPSATDTLYNLISNTLRGLTPVRSIIVVALIKSDEDTPTFAPRPRRRLTGVRCVRDDRRCVHQIRHRWGNSIASQRAIAALTAAGFS